MKQQLVCYDFDTHLYTAAKMLQTDSIIVTHKKTGHQLPFKNISTFKGRSKTKVGGWLKERNDEKGTNLHWDDFDIESISKRNKVKFSKAKDKIERSIETVLEKPWCRELKLIIGGEVNYRKQIYKPYKAKRPPKPLMYSELRKWLTKEFSSFIVVADGCEADDYLSIMIYWMRQFCNGDFDRWDLILAHRDKDLLQCGGWQWNWYEPKKDPVWVSDLMAGRCFWQQMLQGDVTDNIPGLEGVTKEMREEFGFKSYGMGKVSAEMSVLDCSTIEEMEQRVLYLYEKYWSAQKNGDWKKQFQLNYQLLKLMDVKGQIPFYDFERGIHVS